MTETPDDAETTGLPAPSESHEDILFEEYWSDLSSDSSIPPDQWLRARRGDPALGTQLHVLSLLRNVAPELGAWLSPSAENRPTDGKSLTTGHNQPEKLYTPSLSQG